MPRIVTDPLIPAIARVTVGDAVVCRGSRADADKAVLGMKWAESQTVAVEPLDWSAPTNQRIKALGLRLQCRASNNYAKRIMDGDACLGEMDVFEANAFATGAEWVMRKRMEAKA